MKCLLNSERINKENFRFTLGFQVVILMVQDMQSKRLEHLQLIQVLSGVTVTRQKQNGLLHIDTQCSAVNNYRLI